MPSREWARIDVTGQRFGRLVALERMPVRDRRTRWRCVCDCGKESVVMLEGLRGGNTRSCGCAHYDKRYPRRDLAGKRFEKIVVLEFVGRRPDGSGDSLWRYRCDCGNEGVAHGYSIHYGGTRSCGCTIRAALLRVNTKHGRTGSSEYRIWAGMKTRCYNAKEPCHQYYGGRDIGVCDRWKSPDGFVNFLYDMGPRPSSSHSLDRIDVNRGYSPDNCRWATREEQANNKRSTIRVKLNGKEVALKQACTTLGLNYYSMRLRLIRGMSFEEAVKTPFRKTGDESIAGKARKAGIRPQTVFARLRAGWSLEKALSAPLYNIPGVQHVG